MRTFIAVILQSNMVMQQNGPFKVWGYAPGGATVLIQADWMAAPVAVKAEADNKFLGIISISSVRKGDFTKHQLTVSSGDEKTPNCFCFERQGMLVELSKGIDRPKQLNQYDNLPKD